MKRVLIIEDCKFTTGTLKEILKNEGYNVVGHASSGQQGLELAEDLEPDIVTVDNMLPDMIGLDVVKQLKELNDNVKILMISSVGTEKIIQESLQNGASNYLTKPFSSQQLRDSIGVL